jgi:hypothetical protein
MTNCKFCGKLIISNNKHRKSCYRCKIDYPYVAAYKQKLDKEKRPIKGTGGQPFNRKKIINEKLDVL